MSGNQNENQGAGSNSSSDQRRAQRFKPGDIVMVSGISVDSASRKYTPFKAKVVDTSDTGMQLSTVTGPFQPEKDVKIMITNTRERTGDTRHLMIVWAKVSEAETFFGCRYID